MQTRNVWQVQQEARDEAINRQRYKNPHHSFEESMSGNIRCTSTLDLGSFCPLQFHIGILWLYISSHHWEVFDLAQLNLGHSVVTRWLRKSPIRHKVSRHLRRGFVVNSYMRGHGGKINPYVRRTVISGDGEEGKGIWCDQIGAYRVAHCEKCSCHHHQASM